jgi:hypothetical protein
MTDNWGADHDARLRAEAERRWHERENRLRTVAFQRFLSDDVHLLYGDVLQRVVNDNWFFDVMQRSRLALVTDTCDGPCMTAPELRAVQVIPAGLELTFSGVHGQTLADWEAAQSTLSEAFGCPHLVVSSPGPDHFSIHINR